MEKEEESPEWFQPKGGVVTGRSGRESWCEEKSGGGGKACGTAGAGGLQVLGPTGGNRGCPPCEGKEMRRVRSWMDESKQKHDD